MSVFYAGRLPEVATLFVQIVGVKPCVTILASVRLAATFGILNVLSVATVKGCVRLVPRMPAMRNVLSVAPGMSATVVCVTTV